MTAAIQGEYEQLKLLMAQYKEAADQAKQAAEDAYETIKKYEQQQADDIKEDVEKGPSVENETPETNPNPTPNPVPDTPKTPPAIGTWVKLPTGTYFYRANGTNYPNPSIKGRSVQIKSTSGDLWKVYSPELSPSTVYIKKSSIGYDTGGYTGEWGNDGRLAMLHQKELVLNKEDTANMLNAVEIMRGITENIGADLLSRMAGITAGGFNSSLGNGMIDQNVHIEATFPGVKNAVEIETALNNLVNMASQRALQK